MDNIFTGTHPKIIGATVYALNLTHGLAPAREAGEDEIVTEVLNSYSGFIKTDRGNTYSNGDFGIKRFATKRDEPVETNQFTNPDREMTPDEVSLLMTYHRARLEVSFHSASRWPMTPELLTKAIEAAQPTVFARSYDTQHLIEWREFLLKEEEKN